MDVLGEEELQVNRPEKQYKGGLPGYEKLSPEEQNEEMKKLFKKVFSTEDGKIVLGIILEDLHYFAPCNNDDAKALNNYAKALISQRLGLNNSMDIVNRLID